MRPVRSAIAAVVAIVLLGSCSKDTTSPNPAVSSIHVTPGVDSVGTLGRTVTFAAQPVDAGGAPVSATVVWRSSNPAVATVDSATGLATALTNGTTIISAHVGNVSGQATMAVSQVVAHVVISPPSAGFTAVGDTQRLTAVAKDSSGAIVQGVSFLWFSSDANVATVDTAGLVTTKGSGQAFAIAAGRGVPGNATLTVNQTATSLVITQQPTDVVAGDGLSPQVTVEIRDGNGHKVTGTQPTVTLTLPGGSPGALHGTTVVTAIDGVAGFSGIWFDHAAGAYRIVAAASGLVVKDTSAPFAVTPAAPSTAFFETEPSDGQGNFVLPFFQVDVLDRFGNLTDAEVAVSVGTSQYPDFSINGVTDKQTASGHAVFDSVRVDRPGTYTLRAQVFTATGTLPPVESSHFRISLKFQAVATGAFHTCGATAAGVYCWGGDYGSDSIPRLVSSDAFDQLVAGQYFTCGLKADHTVWCWGSVNSEGQLGRGFTGGGSFTPAPVQGALTFTQIAAGANHACGVSAGGGAFCWGSNSSGQLGDSTHVNRGAPTEVARGLTFASLTAGLAHTCGILTDSTVYCWGANGSGQLGNGTTSPDSAPHVVTGMHADAMSATSISTCADSTGNGPLFCWGDDTYGEVGHFGTSSTPTQIAGNGGYTFSGSLGNTFCVVNQNYCYGDNSQGQYGDGSTTSLGPIGGAQPLTGIQQLSGGSHHWCALTAGHVLYCWGGNIAGELGNGTTAASYLPARVIQ